MTLTVGSLFSGIGGFDLGLERAGMKVIWQSEIDSYASQVLEKHWPHVPNLGDMTTTHWGKVKTPDLICGGYPCPAFSYAARGRNTAPNLWPLMRDVIATLKPRYVLIENVAAHLHRGFDDTLSNLDTLGFDVEWTTISACAFGASHPRRRLFAVAYPHGYGQSVLSVDVKASKLCSPPSSRRHWGIPTTRGVRTDDGIPNRVDRNRVLGNAIVPLVAEWIGRRIVGCDAKASIEC